MGIYLPNMEMPKSCSECRFAVDGWCYAYGKPNVDVLSDKGRTNWCPLVYVPPHGDLIDAQAEMRLMQSYDYDTYDDYNRAFDMLDNAPTIIPAEEDEGGKL